MDVDGHELTKRNADLFERVVGILEQARTHVSRTVNSAMVVAYWLIGREIVVEEQLGRKRAEYGKALIEVLSRRLAERFGKGFSASNLWNFRQFYQTFADRSPEILYPMGRESGGPGKLHPAGGKSTLGFHPDLRGKQRIFASRYKLELPSKEKLRSLMLEWRAEREERNRE